MDDAVEVEDARVAKLLAAQANAVALFAAVEQRQLIVAGATELQVSDAIRALAMEMFDIKRFWHKRVVRAGPNTLQPYRRNPPNRLIDADDIVFCDFGPIFEQWEADFGATYVLGTDPRKLALRDSLTQVWRAGRAAFAADPEITGEALFARVVDLSEQAGWEFGGTIAGHLVGEFPHEKITGDGVDAHIMPGSDKPMRRNDPSGRSCHWILEVHLVDRARQIGGFCEQLLDIGPDIAS